MTCGTFTVEVKQFWYRSPSPPLRHLSETATLIGLCRALDHPTIVEKNLRMHRMRRRKVSCGAQNIFIVMGLEPQRICRRCCKHGIALRSNIAEHQRCHPRCLPLCQIDQLITVERATRGGSHRGYTQEYLLVI